MVTKFEVLKLKYSELLHLKICLANSFLTQSKHRAARKRSGTNCPA